MTAKLIMGSGPPKLARYLNLFTTLGLPTWSASPKSWTQQEAILKQWNIQGIQEPYPELQRVNTQLPVTGHGRVDAVGDAYELAIRHQDYGFKATTLHVGSGLESDIEALRLLEAVVQASDKSGYPMFVELHRATVTQDIVRTLQFIETIPDLYLNGDFSHWYTGLEMPYGDWFAKLDRLAPVFERIRFLHVRIGSSSVMQLPVSCAGDKRIFVEHYRELFKRSASGFLKHASQGEVLPAAVELLPLYGKVSGEPVQFNYALPANPLTAEGELTDRWTQIPYLWKIVEESAQRAGLSIA